MVTGAAAALVFVNPNKVHVPLCPLHAATGLWCPLCGATRASYALVHADPVTALHDNLLYVLLLPALLLYGWQGLRPSRGGRQLPRLMIWSLSILALGFTVLRNVPAGAWLAPPG